MKLFLVIFCLCLGGWWFLAVGIPAVFIYIYEAGWTDAIIHYGKYGMGVSVCLYITMVVYHAIDYTKADTNPERHYPL